MNLAQAQKSLAYITLVVAVIVLVVAGVVGPIGLVALPIAVCVSWFWEPTTASIERQRAFWNVTLLGFIGLTAWKVLVGGVAVLQPAVDLVLVLVVAKLFQRGSARDYTQIYALTFLMVAVATVLDDGLHFGLLLAVYLVFCAGGFTINQIAARTEGTRTPAQAIRVPGRYVALLAAMSGLLMLMSAGFFVILPRVGIGMGGVSAGGSEPTKMTGFSESIDLSDHGVLGLDETIVLRAEIDGPPGSLYWRGISFDRFDGRRWSISPELRRRREIESGGQGARFELPAPRAGDARSPRPVAGTTSRVRQEIELEPLEADVLLALPRAVAVEYPAREGQVVPSWHDVSIDRTGSLYHGFGPRQRVHYIIESQLEPFEAGAERYDPDEALPPAVARYYLTLPRLSKRVRRLAVDLVRGTDDPVEMARRIERHLATQYGYTLELPARGADPIDNFLFDDRRGHCEFFSTSMVVLLRAIGVPARNVNGFQGGEYNEVGGYWIVRRLHAHSWVEVWIPGVGWRTFDPTPEMGLPERRASGMDERELGTIDGWLDQLRRLWRGWVLDYDLRQQLSLLGVGDEDESGASRGLLGRLWTSLVTSWWRWLLVLGWCLAVGWWLRRATRSWPVVLVGEVGGVALCQVLWPVPALFPSLVVALGVGWLAWRLRISSLENETSVAGAPLSRVYLALVAVLRRDASLSDAHRLGPEQLARRLDVRGGGLDGEVAAFVRRYARLRFGPGRVGRDEVRALRRQGRRLRRALRRAA